MRVSLSEGGAVNKVKGVQLFKLDSNKAGAVVVRSPHTPILSCQRRVIDSFKGIGQQHAKRV